MLPPASVRQPLIVHISEHPGTTGPGTTGQTSRVDELYRLARIKAAEQATSLSALVKAFIIRLTGNEAAESEFQRLEREEQELRAELRARRISLNPAHNLRRDELHTRHALR